MKRPFLELFTLKLFMAHRWLRLKVKIGPHPQYGWDFPEEIPEKFRKDPGNALRAFPGIPVESTAGMPQTLQCKAFEASRAFPEFSPPQYGWGRLFFQKWFRRGSLRAGHGVPSSTGGISERLNFPGFPKGGLVSRKRGPQKLDTAYDRVKVPPYNGNDHRPPLVVYKPFCFHPYSTKYKRRERKGYKRGPARNFFHSFPLSSTPVVQSYWAWKNGVRNRCPHR